MGRPNEKGHPPKTRGGDAYAGTRSTSAQGRCAFADTSEDCTKPDRIVLASRQNARIGLRRRVYTWGITMDPQAGSPETTPSRLTGGNSIIPNHTISAGPIRIGMNRGTGESNQRADIRRTYPRVERSDYLPWITEGHMDMRPDLRAEPVPTGRGVWRGSTIRGKSSDSNPRRSIIAKFS